MELKQEGKTEMLVLNEGEEIIITTSNKEKGYVSIYNDGSKMRIDGTITNRTYKIPYKERKEKNAVKHN